LVSALREKCYRCHVARRRGFVKIHRVDSVSEIAPPPPPPARTRGLAYGAYHMLAELC
jgi:hypothetical protein